MFTMLLQIIEIIFNDTTAIILQGENLLRKFMEVGDSSVENLHTCVAKFMKLRASGIDQCDSLERLDYRSLIEATSDKLKEGSRCVILYARTVIERRTRKLIIEIIKHRVQCYYHYLYTYIVIF